jgi:hypothetical protein
MKKTSIFVLIFILAFWTTVPSWGKELVDNRPSMVVDVSPACMNKDIAIKISNQKGTLMEGVDIDIIIRSKKVAYGKTNEEGVFSFTPKDMGANQMTAKKDGYKDATVQINVSNCVVTTVQKSIASTTSSRAVVTTPTTTTLRTQTTFKVQETTTTLFSCNANRRCESGENYNNCPGDCLSGGLDGLCDRVWDGVCDPDCYRKDDQDCLCNNNSQCEADFESVVNCQSDCPSGAADGVCDSIADGKCDPDCPNGAGDTDCKPADYATMVFPLIFIIVLFGAFAAINMKREAAKHIVETSKEDTVEDIKKRLRNGEDPAVIKKELAASGLDASLLEKAEKTIWE